MPSGCATAPKRSSARATTCCRSGRTGWMRAPGCPRPNCDVIYSMSYLDLKETGAFVVRAPPNVIGMFTDFFQRTITDVGAIGPDRARGGTLSASAAGLPGRDPAGYFVFKSRDLQRLPLLPHHDGTKGENGPDPTAAVANAERPGLSSGRSSRRTSSRCSSLTARVYG